MNGSTRVVLGLDGGGTKTVCVTVANQPSDPYPEPLARTVVGSTNWNSVGADEARHNLQMAIEHTVAAAGVSKAEVDAFCLGMSGVDRPEDHERMQTWLRELLPGTPALIHNDAVVALASGTGGRLFGVVLISGTGMIAMGFDSDGERRRAGGWGALLGDGGSGYAIGAAVLRAVTWAADGRAPRTSLTRATLDRLHMEREDQLVRWAYDDVSWHRIAELAQLAQQEATSGDAQALSILRAAVIDLALAAESVARQLRIESEPFPLVLAGGGLRPGILSDALRRRFRTTLPQASVVLPAVEPAIGAAMLAIRHLDTKGV